VALLLKHQGAAVVLVHRAEQSLSSNNVHIPVAQRLLNRFAHSLESSEMNHRFNRLAERFGACEQRIQALGIPMSPSTRVNVPVP